MFLALIIAATLTAPTPRFKRFDSRKVEGRSTRGFPASNSAVADYVPMFSFAPAGGAGLGGDCSCAEVTDSTGDVAMSFTRSTAALCVSGQTFAECPADRPRIQGGAFLMEAASTNLFTRSDLFSAGIWAKAGVTITEDYGLSPIGTMTADRLQVSACPSNGTFNLVYQGVTTSTGTVASAWIKGTSGSGTLQGYSYGGGSGTTTACNYTADAWTQCVHVRAVGQAEAGFGCVNSTLVTGPGNTGAADVLIWRGVLTDGLVLVSGIETGPAPVERAADSQLAGTYSTPIAAGNYCVAASVQKTNSNFGGTTNFLILKDSTTNNLTAGMTSSTALALVVGAASTTPTVTAVSTTLHRIVWGNVSGTSSITWDGAAVTPAPNSATTQTNDRVLIGSVNTLTSRVVVDVSGCQ